MKKILLVLVLCLMTFSFIACQKKTDSSKSAVNTETEKKENEKGEGNMEDAKNPMVTITMKDGGKIVLELFPDKAPNTVNNFISLVNKKFYDGLIFHRVIPNFMIQGGDPLGTGMGGSEHMIKGEFANNNFAQNNISHTRGVISMARTNEPDTASSQFFICNANATFLDKEYAAFGIVREGIEEVDKITATETDENDKPKVDQVIKTIIVDTKGKKYPEPTYVN